MRCKKTLSRGKPGFDFRTDTLSHRRVTCIRSRIRFFTNFFRMKSIVSLKTDFLRRNRSIIGNAYEKMCESKERNGFTITRIESKPGLNKGK